MRWRRRGRSANLEDRRGQTGGRLRRGGSIGLGGLVVVFLLSIVFKQDFFALLGTGGLGGGTSSPVGSDVAPVTTPEEEELVDFMSFVLDDTQQTWAGLLQGYREAKMVLFRDAVQSACGFAQSAMGPFYCPADEKVYLDLGFFDDLRQRFGAPGDFAQAYVIAHEIGHHVQNLLGIEKEVRRAQSSRPGDRNELSVRMELQADCFAGVWGRATARRDILEAGDIEEGLNAAAAIGDDRIQGMSQGRVVPESFTHGSSAQRVSWFRTGLESGNPEDCNTFSQ